MKRVVAAVLSASLLAACYGESGQDADIDDFLNMDRNGDGFISMYEYQSYTHKKDTMLAVSAEGHIHHHKVSKANAKEKTKVLPASGGMWTKGGTSVAQKEEQLQELKRSGNLGDPCGPDTNVQCQQTEIPRVTCAAPPSLTNVATMNRCCILSVPGSGEWEREENGQIHIELDEADMTTINWPPSDVNETINEVDQTINDPFPTVIPEPNLGTGEKLGGLGNRCGLGNSDTVCHSSSRQLLCYSLDWKTLKKCCITGPENLRSICDSPEQVSEQGWTCDVNKLRPDCTKYAAVNEGSCCTGAPGTLTITNGDYSHKEKLCK